MEGKTSNIDSSRSVPAPQAAAPVQDFGDWLKARAGGETGAAGSAAPNKGSGWTADWLLGWATAASGTIACIGLAFEPYHPVRFLLMYGMGLSAGVAGFLGLYVLGFCTVRMIETRARHTLPMILAGMLIGVGAFGLEARTRSLEAQAEAAGRQVPVRDLARARRWIP